MAQFILILIFAFFPPPQQRGQAPDLSTQFSHAIELQQQGKLSEAAEEYRAILKTNPSYAEAHANLGVVMARLGNFDEAVASYEAALRLNPKLTQVLLNLGILHYRANRYEKAVETLEKFLDATPGNVQASLLLGLSLLEIGRDNDAIKYLEPTLLAGPDDAGALYGLGLAYLRQNRPELSWAIEKLSTLPSGVPASHLLRGQMFLARFEFEKAIAELKEAQKLNPELPRLYYSLGLCYYKLGRNREAIDAFGKELGRRPQDFTTNYYLALLQESEGKLDEAMRRLDVALKVSPEAVETNALLGKIL
ncbi:MAG: tetratricopeptide repeat protein, partial [Chloracidobacterium sp.]|nr:tetratricopeptide repeat protein [Chloracidobacterium sp.]